jgi:putative DNA primase/helicase
VNPCRAAAEKYILRGYVPVPVRAGEKIPTVAAWQDLRLTVDDLPLYFSNHENVGLLNGAPSGGLVDVDLDAKEAILLADEFLPNTSLVHGRPGKPRSHRWYRTTPAPASQRFTDPEGGGGDDTACVIEIRSTGTQTVVPPSRHPCGEAIEWDEEGEPAQIDASELRKRVRRLAACALTARHWPAQGGRHEAALALSGMLLRAGWPVEEVEHLVVNAARVGGDEEWSKRAQDVRSTARAVADEKNVTGTPTLASIVGDRVVAKLREWLEVAFEEWPDPLPLPKLLPKVLEFSEFLLPDPLQQWAMDIADRMQCPPDFVAAAAIVEIGSVIGRTITIRPKRVDPWTVVPNLWGIVIGKPGTKKSPALAEALSPISRLIAAASEAYRARVEEYESQRVDLEAQRAALKDEMRKRHKRGESTDDLREQYNILKDTPPTERRYLINDATVEKLGELLNQNPNGLLLFRDELAGFLTTMDRQGHENDRPFYLESWDGKRSYGYDRIGRGTLHIAANCMSILGSIQPDRLTQYLHEALQAQAGDGLIQRFQVMVFPDPVKFEHVDRAPNAGARDRVFKIVERLDTMSAMAFGAEPVEDDALPSLHFTAEAQREFDGWYVALHNRLADDEEHPAIVGHLAKYDKLMPALALIFHAVAVADGEPPGPVSLDAAYLAMGWCDFLEQHARRVYHSVVHRVDVSAELLGKKIKAGRLGPTFSGRDLYRHQWTGLSSREDTEPALELLEEYGWIRAIRPPTGVPGRPTTPIYIVNPKLGVKYPPTTPDGEADS